MEDIKQVATNYQQNNAYNKTHILNLLPKEVWLQIVARSTAKDTLRKTCIYFYDFASTRNEKLFPKDPLHITSEVLERFALYYADFANNAILNNLLLHGANPNTADDKGNSLMHFAAQNGNLEMVKTLLAHPQFDASNMATKNSPLLLAAHYKKIDVVKHILSHCTINYNIMLCHAIYYRLSDFTELLFTHISENDIKIDKEIIREPKKDAYNPVILDDRYGRRPLHYAITSKDAHTAQRLLSHNIDIVDAEDEYSYTPFHYAIIYNATNMIKLLIDNKANINHVCLHSRRTSLHHAAEFGLMTKALFLLKNGVDINAKTSQGNTALMIASIYGHTQLVKLLLAYNANVNEHDNKGLTALNLAHNNHHVTVMRILLDHPDIDIEQAYNSKNLALLSIIIRDYKNSKYRNEYYDMFDVIIEKTDINTTDIYGNNPLSYAYWENNIEMTLKLISHPKVQMNTLFGKNLSDEFEENRRNYYGYKRSGPVTFLDLVMNGHNINKDTLIDFLRQRGAKTKAELEEEKLLEKI